MRRKRFRHRVVSAIRFNFEDRTVNSLPSDRFELEVFFDGGCPLCQREIDLLKKMDRDHRLRFTDIDDSDFDATLLGKSHQQLMERMHARLPDGTWIDGVEVFRRMYSAVGYRTIASLTRLPLISSLLDLAYSLFARNRLRLTGRCERGRCVHSSDTKSIDR